MKRLLTRISFLFAVHQKKNDYYFEIPTSLLGRDLLVVNKLQRVPTELNDAGVNRGVNYENQMVCMEWDKATGKLMLRQQRPLPMAFPVKVLIPLSA